MAPPGGDRPGMSQLYNTLSHPFPGLSLLLPCLLSPCSPSTTPPPSPNLTPSTPAFHSQHVGAPIYHPPPSPSSPGPHPDHPLHSPSHLFPPLPRHPRPRSVIRRGAVKVAPGEHSRTQCNPSRGLQHLQSPWTHRCRLMADPVTLMNIHDLVTTGGHMTPGRCPQWALRVTLVLTGG